MKTQWTWPYISRKIRPHDWCRAKQLELQAQTGVSWSFDRAYDKVRFAPAFKAREADFNDNSADQDAVMAILNAKGWLGIVSFLELAETLDWTLVKLFATLNCLRDPKAPKVTFTVNRMGDAVGVKAIKPGPNLSRVLNVLYKPIELLGQ